MSRKKPGEDSQDNIDDEIIKQVRWERAFTEIKSNRLQQEVIDDRRGELVEAKKRKIADAKREEPEETFFSDTTFEEIKQTVEELPANNYNLYMVLGLSLDRIKKLKPKDARRELRALAKMIALRDPSEIQKTFFEAMKFGSEMQTQINKGLSQAKTQGEKTQLITEVFKTILEKSTATTTLETPILFTLDQYFGSTVAGGSVTFLATVYGGTGEVELSAKNGPKNMTASWASSQVVYPAPGFEGQVKLSPPTSAQTGAYAITIISTDSKGKTASVVYTLTIT